MISEYNEIMNQIYNLKDILTKHNAAIKEMYEKRQIGKGIRRLASKQQWEPIETAPKGDGTKIIAWDPEFWREKFYSETPIGTSGEAMWVGLSERWVLFRHPESTFNPTLWIPLSEPVENQ